MATNSEAVEPRGGLGLLAFVLAGRPLFALAVVWLTTAGHTMNLRELGVARGWVAAELFSLQTAFLFSLALMLLACPVLSGRFADRRLTEAGLVVLAGGSFLNGWYAHASLTVFLLGRALAGCGAAVVLYFAPRLLDGRWKLPSAWAGIFLPVAGPAVIAAASMTQGVSDWEWGYFSEGAAALAALLVLLPMTPPSAAEPAARTAAIELAYLPPLAVGFAVLGYVLHWGQLSGWLEEFKIVAATALGIAAFALSGWLAAPRLDLSALAENGLRLFLFFYGGLNQYFHGYTMNIYGGLLVNFSTWQRSWLIWSMPLGVAVSLFATLLLHRRRGLAPGLLGAVAGLLLLAAGLYLNHRATLDWPFWQILNLLDLNWFAAPQHWELAPGRFLMGAGVGLIMSAMDKHASPDHAREEKVRLHLLVVQMLGGGFGSALIVNFLLIGHPLQYSYSADRGYIQADELTDRRARLRDTLASEGQPAPDRTAEALIFKAINYEADNMVFAFIYGAFLAASLFLAVLTLGLWLWRRLRRFARMPAS